MTGLEVGVDELIEVAAIVTDFDLKPVDDGIDVVIKPSDAARQNMNEFVTNMHRESGLIDELDGGTTVEDAQNAVLEYIRKHVPVSGKAPLGGNSVGTDKMFLQKQMPDLVNYLHYRIIDVSSIKELAKRWFPSTYYSAPAKTGNHRALGDILDSIAELAYYRRAVFTSEALDSKASSKLAAEVAAEYFPEDRAEDAEEPGGTSAGS